MAGSYSDAPAPRIPYDLHGGRLNVRSATTGSTGTGAEATISSAAELAKLNNEGNDWPTVGIANDFANWYSTLLLPYAVDLRGAYVAAVDRNGTPLSSTGITFSAYANNVWTVINNGAPASDVASTYRDGIHAVSIDDVTAVRFDAVTLKQGPLQYAALHLYGWPAAVSQERLHIWDPVADVRIAGNHFDLGDIVSGTTHDVDFRVKNGHTLTANNVSLSAESLSMDMAAGITFSDGGAFAAPLDIGNLAPGATSGVITMRRTVAASGDLGLKAARLIAAPGSWSA